jgi:hypothetical protein
MLTTRSSPGAYACSPLQLSSFSSLLLRKIALAAIVLPDKQMPMAETI